MYSSSARAYIAGMYGYMSGGPR